MIASPSTAPVSSRLILLLSRFQSMHSLDPTSSAVEYHRTLADYVHKLTAQQGKTPSEALVISAACQHVRRWERPRSDWPEGLSGYKTWRTQLNKFHADMAQSTMYECGFQQGSEEDERLVERVRELLLKKTLQRPPLPREEELKDPEAHLFEDAICLTFLRLQFVTFSQPYLPSSQPSPSPQPAMPGQPESTLSSTAKPRSAPTPEKLAGIVAKTWAKMTPSGRQVAVRELVGGLPEELKEVVLGAVSGVKDAWEQ
ncbi:hypothetical protein JCM11641_005177 [Rhodosporidiobolus odoratus]